MNDNVTHIPALTHAGARRILDAAVAKAAAIGVPENIVVVDAGAHLLAFARMDGARIGSIAIATTKAESAALRKRATGDEGGGDAVLQVKLALAAGKLTGIGGGFPIVVEGAVVGAIGVSSGTVDEDIVVAQAGLAALDA
jgi:uncharacterized protein GlcG (DUF336 family)